MIAETHRPNSQILLAETVARSEWKGHVTMPKGWRLQYVPDDEAADRRHCGRRDFCAARESSGRNESPYAASERRSVSMNG
jgi:hypothetical protein